jgi:hypothetical protein
VAAENCHVEVIQKLWDLAKGQELTPEELINGVLLSKDQFDKTAWHTAAIGGHVEETQKLWDFAKELQLTSEELKNDVLLSKTS